MSYVSLPPLPPEFIANMTRLLGDEAAAFLASFDEPPRLSLRGNPLRASWQTEAARYASDPVTWCDLGRYLLPDSRPGLSLAHFAGEFYIQESAAMAPVEVLAPVPGEKVLDLCAAPGGKSTQILSRLLGRGALLANEIDGKRAQLLKSAIERMGFINAAVTSNTSEDIARELPDAFDAVLCDAPCSGEGMFRRDPASRAEWHAASPAGCAERQLGILLNAAKSVRPGGRLVYSTCTFNDTEDEGVVRAFLAVREDFHLTGFDTGRLASSDGIGRLWPHKDACEGHFFALFTREGEKEARLSGGNTARQALSREGKALFDLAGREFGQLPESEYGVIRGELWALPDLPPLARLTVISPGCRVTESVGKTVRPFHSLSRAIARPRSSASLSEGEAVRYVAGEELPHDAPDGWTLVTCRGMPLGWAKASRGVLKNHLPKGLRDTRIK